MEVLMHQLRMIDVQEIPAPRPPPPPPIPPEPPSPEKPKKPTLPNRSYTRGNSATKLWTQDIKITCPKCSQSSLNSCYHDALCAEWAQKLNAMKNVSWELHYHWFEHKPYIVFLRYQTDRGNLTNTVISGTLPEDAFEECTTLLKTKGRNG
jgi:hypothetical protein